MGVPSPPPSTPVLSVETMAELPHQVTLIVEQHEPATGNMSRSGSDPEPGLSHTGIEAPGHGAVEGPPSYSTETDKSSNEPNATGFTIPQREKFHLIDSTETPAPPSPFANPLTSALLLQYSEIWTAKGYHTLPFANCGDRMYRFYGFSTAASLAALNLCQKLRTCAPPDRWSDLHGNTVTCGRVVGMQRPEVNTGPVLAGHLGELQDVAGCSYVLVRKGRCTKNPWDKGGSAYLNGDSVYQWVAYVSLAHAQAGVVDSLSSGYSIVGHWVEFDASKVSTAKLARLAGQKFVVEKRRIFAAVDAASFKSFMGWRERIRALLS